MPGTARPSRGSPPAGRRCRPGMRPRGGLHAGEGLVVSHRRGGGQGRRLWLGQILTRAPAPPGVDDAQERRGEGAGATNVPGRLGLGDPTPSPPHPDAS